MNYLTHRIGSWRYLALGCWALTALTAIAQDNDPESRVRAIIDKFLDDMTANPALEVAIDRDYELTVDGETYTTQFTDITIATETGSIQLPPLEVVIIPDNGGLSEISIDLGDTLTVQEGDQTVATLTIGEDVGQGVWDEELEVFISQNLQLSDLQLVFADNPAVATLTSISYTTTTTQGDDDQWSSAGQFQASDLEVSGDGQTFTLSSIAGDIDVNGNNLQQLIALSEKVQSQASDETADDETISQDLLSSLVELYSYFGGFSGDFSLRDLALKQGDTPVGSLGELGFGAHFSQAEGDSGGTIGYQIALTDFQSAMAPLPPGVVPSDIRLEIGLENIPSTLVDTALDIAANPDLSDEEKQARLSQELMAIVMDSELSAYIRDTYITAPEAAINLDMTAQVSPEAAMGASGEVMLRIIGLDTIIQNTGIDQNPNIAPVLAMLTAMSNRTEEDGKMVDTFDLNISPAGQLLLNNKDVTGMVMGGAPGAGAPQTDDSQAPATD